MKRDPKLIFSNAGRVIVKVGSKVLTEDLELNLKAIRFINPMMKSSTGITLH